jgi:hypothetical protein
MRYLWPSVSMFEVGSVVAGKYRIEGGEVSVPVSPKTLGLGGALLGTTTYDDVVLVRLR